MSKSIIPPTGDKGLNWPASFVLPQGKQGLLSDAGWKEGSEGFPQQTFLGASIRSFNVNAGFGDTTSTLSVELVNDEYNASDGTSLGFGDDVYHNGDTPNYDPVDGAGYKGDKFMPPVVGAPVFFKFGGNPATVEQAWRVVFDRTYGYNTLVAPAYFPTVTTNGEITRVPGNYHYLRSSKGNVHTWVDKSALYDSSTHWRGKDHFSFGGILQSYTQNRGPDGNPLYSVQVTDPREILMNATVILSNYAGTTYNNKNLINLFGFLEHDPSDGLRQSLDSAAISKNPVQKVVFPNGNVTYVGDDLYKFISLSSYSHSAVPSQLPITGQGFARRSDKGIPWYRVRDGLRALFNYDGALPQEYVNAGYGGAIDFRGYKYIIDFSGIPVDQIPLLYYINFDQLDLLSLAQELCDVISHDLFVSLLPVIDHPSIKPVYDYNQYIMANATTDAEKAQVITGIIRIDAIDKRRQPKYGAIKSYLDTLASRGVAVENQDLGFELANVTTDKFVVGAQEVEMYYFSNNKDRDNLQYRLHNNATSNQFEYMQHIKWDLETSLKQQILPFYGFLGQSKAVSIPRGFGSYQQIMLDTRDLNAYGVGNYYIATEIELRAALVSYDQWVKFLLQYDEVYIQEMSSNSTFAAVLDPERTIKADLAEKLEGIPPNSKKYLKSVLQDDAGSPRDFGVSVPRCVFNSDRDYMGSDGYPASPCAPPYGYPLYYKRAEKIGIPQAGLVSIQQAHITCLSDIGRLNKKLDENAPTLRLNTRQPNEELKKLRTEMEKLHQTFEEAKRSPSTLGGYLLKVLNLENQINQARKVVSDLEEEFRSEELKTLFEIQEIKDTLEESKQLLLNIPRLAKEHEKNARKVYDFIKRVANDNLGKKFLVKIPTKCNVNYANRIQLATGEKGDSGQIAFGPFGFQPLPLGNFNLNYLAGLRRSADSEDVFEHYLDNAERGYTNGALKSNFNPFSEKWEFNYKPEPNGGFFNFSLYSRSFSASEAANVNDFKMPFAVQDLLCPADLTNLLKGDSRVSCYARYDHSENYDLSAVGAQNISQVALKDGRLVPDVIDTLDNLNPNKKISLAQTRTNTEEATVHDLEKLQKPSIAYVKCSVDEDLYMAPRTTVVSTKVWARDYKLKINMPAPRVIDVDDPENPGCKIKKTVYPRVTPSFAPANSGKKEVNRTDFIRIFDSRLNGQIVNTRLEALDPNNVYALVTIPGRAKPIVDFRYNDGPSQSFNTVKMYNLMTRDVVKNAPGFDQPEALTNDRDGFDCSGLKKFNAEALTEGRRLQNQVNDQMGYFGMDAKLTFTSPSPVYPDVVAIPLMSMERCYGPWLSSASIDPFNGSPGVSNIGGKIEFVKDENLAPWNFAGYQLMNEAGSLQAKFSNSLLLFSERGGFVIPEAPTGISLANALKSGGPLVTSISVDIGTDKISTTVQMDLYTSSFGKMQKQKEMAISQVARERQKITDANNAAIRRGLGKSMSNNNLLGGLLANGGQNLINRTKETEQYFSSLEKGEEKNDNIQIIENITVDESLIDADTGTHLTGSQLSKNQTNMISSSISKQNERAGAAKPASKWKLSSDQAIIETKEVWQAVPEGPDGRAWMPRVYNQYSDVTKRKENPGK